MRHTAIVLAFLLSVTLITLSAGPAAAGKPGGLFHEAPTEALVPADDLATLRSRPVEVDFKLLTDSATAWQEAEGSTHLTLELNLFPDATFEAVLDRIAFEWPTNLTWIGHVSGVEGSTVVLVAGGGVLVGSVHLVDTAYRIRYTPEGVHVVEEVDLAGFPPEAEPQPIGAAGVDLAARSYAGLFSDGAEGEADPSLAELAFESTAIDDGKTVDLMVVYTPAARSAAGGTTAMQNLITLGVSETNIAFANSYVVQRLRLVYTAEVSYTESGNLATDRDRLQAKSDGYMDSVHSLRDTYRADLVKLVVVNSAGGACGISYLMAGSNNRAFEAYGFTVTARPCISPNYTFGHELGHNMGANHAPGDPTGTGAFSYSFGYRDPLARFRSIMAYNCSPSCPRLLYFSSPAVTYNGAVVGTTSQNNAASDTNVRSVVASFRLSQNGPTCSGTSGQWAGCRGHGCAVCVEKVASYPLYYHNNPMCSPNTTCAGQYYTCNVNCPAPDSADLCNGTSGQWAGCRGDGCSVCMEKLANYPLYFQNHPACKRNDTCANQFYTCNVNCPSPTSADQCNGTPGQWAGCRGTGCHVCAELVANYPCYFTNHPLCNRNTTCAGQYFTCNANCPAPTSADAC